MTSTWSFHCNACGKCCNSPPQTSLPELFHHAHRFVGALGVRKIRPVRADLLRTELLHPGYMPGEWIALSPLAIDYPTSGRCPALQEDGRCAVHSDRKPKACATVPLDPLLADSHQHAVLAARSRGGDEYLGADCIQPGGHPSFALHVEGPRVVDEVAREALAARRAELAADKFWWGDAVFALLTQGGLPAHPLDEGVLTLPLAPVLQRLANLSARCHARCIAYLHAQQTLIAWQIDLALRRKDSRERTFTARLRGLADTNDRLLRSLRSPPEDDPQFALAEAWLGQG